MFTTWFADSLQTRTDTRGQNIYVYIYPRITRPASNLVPSLQKICGYEYRRRRFVTNYIRLGFYTRNRDGRGLTMQRTRQEHAEEQN